MAAGCKRQVLSTGVNEEAKTWNGWKQLGYEVLHGSKGDGQMRWRKLHTCYDVFWHKFIYAVHTIIEVTNMDKKQERQNRKQDLNKFNSITQKVKPENQNQEHNVRAEAVEPKNRQV